MNSRNSTQRETNSTDADAPLTSRFGTTRSRVLVAVAASATVAAVCLGFGIVSAQASSSETATARVSTSERSASAPVSIDTNASGGVAPAATTPMLPAATATDGWLRIAHLSPDTAAVNVKLTALSGGAQTIELDNVAYGAVSPYMHVPSGTYVVSMFPWKSGGKAGTKPMVTASVKIVQGKSVTVAAFGKNKSLSTKVFQDDLAAPTDGSARIRLIQASTITKSVTVETTTGQLIASGAKSGVSTTYADVPAGKWVLNLRSTSMTDAAAVSLANGSVNTLFVLDNASGGLTIKPVLDSSGVGSNPVGGINTGGGWAATHDLAAVESRG